MCAEKGTIQTAKSGKQQHSLGVLAPKCWESMERAHNENVVNEMATALQTANAEPGERQQQS